jgi:hypothetical protein
VKTKGSKKPAAGKSLEAFAAAHDPTHKVDSPLQVYGRELLRRGSRRTYIITAAQNATPVHEGFWAVLKSIADANSADILVVPMRYKNPTSDFAASQRNAEWWTSEVRDYLWNQRLVINENLELLADIKIQPTASSPLTGAEAISTHRSAIIGHTKVHTRSVPTPQNRMAKLVMTTGACTVQNYSNTRAGVIGQFHHSLSALIVEVDGKRFHMRRLHWDEKTKTVTDLATRYDADGAEPAPPALALVMGDTHVDSIDPAVERATFGKGGLVELLRPKALVWHDLLDGYAVNPHHNGNAFNKIAKQRSGANDVRAEVERAIAFVRERTPEGTESLVVSSNHDDFLRRWVVNTDWREDPVNAEFYLETALAMAQVTKLGPGGTECTSPFAYWFAKAKVPRASMLGGGTSYALAGVELALHGDRGPNGARGSIQNMRRLGVKTIIGHSHSPGEDEGCTQVGTSTRLNLEYTSGPSSWLNAHCALNADGKRQLIVIIDGKYCL